MGIELSAKEVDELATILTRYTAGFGVLELLLADEKIQDVFINSPIGLSPIYVLHSDFEECETAYNTARGVECYERVKPKGPCVIHPFSTGITYALIERATKVKTEISEYFKTGFIEF
jgi:hypothetical protein